MTPPYWDITGPKLSKAELEKLRSMKLRTREEFQANVMRRVELNGITVVGTVATAAPDRSVDFNFHGPTEFMNEYEALLASMEIVHVLMTGRAADPSHVSVREETSQ